MKQRLNEYRFDAIVPREIVHQAGIETRRTAVLLTQRNYCKAMINMGACTEDCTNCRATLLAAFQGVDPSRAKNPSAVLTWRLRNAQMTQIEQHVAENKSQPVSDGGNSFTALEEFLR